jgi:hypothetical protein
MLDTLIKNARAPVGRSIIARAKGITTFVAGVQVIARGERDRRGAGSGAAQR